jgi:predicted NAD-dependent protein-ADP-ribosyltransferase YbiA (DUF1768 family)
MLLNRRDGVVSLAPQTVCSHPRSFYNSCPATISGTFSHTHTESDQDPIMAPRKKKGAVDDATKATKATKAPAATRATKTAAKSEGKAGKASAAKPESKAGKASAAKPESKAGKASAAKPESKAGKASAAKPANKAGKSPASQLTNPAEPIFFYGHTNPNGWLSQFYESEFDHNGKTYVCNEQFFQYAKATLFRDFVGCNLSETIKQDVDKYQVTGNAILQASSPKVHKSLGKKVTPFEADAWSSGEFQKLVSEADRLILCCSGL